MRTLLIPREGEPFFGDNIPEDQVGGNIVRLAHNVTPAQSAQFDPTVGQQPVNVENYSYKSVVIRRGGQPMLAIYEQV